jgi:Holliday junction resolvasome RuvABC DNA-binding subunit
VDRAKAKADKVATNQAKKRAKQREQKKKQTRSKPQGGKEALQRLGVKQKNIPNVHDTFKGKAMKPSRRQQQQKILKVGMNALVG